MYFVGSYRRCSGYSREFTIDRYKRFLPSPTSRSTDRSSLNVYNRWAVRSILVTDNELRTIVQFEISDEHSPLLKEASVCYFRSWQITKQRLSSLIQDIENQGFYFRETYHWKSYIRNIELATPVTIRYVGQVSDHSGNHQLNPHCRSRRDQNNATKGSTSMLLGTFLRTFKHLYLDILRSGRTYSLSDTYLPWMDGSRRTIETLIDRYERFFISFFDYPLLLNQKWTVQRNAKFPNTEITPMSTACVETLIQQASPRTVLGHSLAAICGHSNTREAFTKGLSFFEAGSTTAKFINCTFRLLSNVEGVSHNCNRVELKNYLTFNNLYPWYPFKQSIKADVKIALIRTSNSNLVSEKWLTIVQAFLRR